MRCTTLLIKSLDILENMQNSTTFVQTVEVKQKYDGKFTHISEFNCNFEARLRQHNPAIHWLCQENATNIRDEEFILQTQSGSIKTTEIADVGEAKDVIINEKGDVNLLSQIRWLRQHPTTATITTVNAAYEVPIKIVENIIENEEPIRLIHIGRFYEI